MLGKDGRLKSLGYGPSFVVGRGGDCETRIVDDDIEASFANRGSVGVAYLRPWRGLHAGLNTEE
jgi:hypothetical protein